MTGGWMLAGYTIVWDVHNYSIDGSKLSLRAKQVLYLIIDELLKGSGDRWTVQCSAASHLKCPPQKWKAYHEDNCTEVLTWEVLPR